MPEHASSAWTLAAAMLASGVGMGWLALAMPVHAAQAWGGLPADAGLRRLRGCGALSLVVALLLCLHADHPSMAVLVWVMSLAAGALCVAFVLAMRPRWLRWLAPWLAARGRARNPAR